MKEFKGRTAFITGAASGIGLGMARAFGRAGMNVVVADIDKNAAKSAAERLASEQIRAVPVICDVTERASVRAAALETVAQFGKVHVVCNNAGVAVTGAIGAIKERDWDWIIDVNLKGVVHGVETFAPLIKSHGEGGHIVNTASMAGLLAFPMAEPYTATKFAVVAMSEGWAGQLRPFDIGVSVLCPGFVRTQIFDSGRARPDRYGGKAEPMSEQGAQAVMAGIDPDIVGNRVVEAVRDNDFYCFTHPNFGDVMEIRFEQIRAGFAKAEQSEALKAVKNWPSALGTPADD